MNQALLGLAIDASGDVWSVGGGDPLCLSEFSNSGLAISPSTGYVGGGLENPNGLGIDGSGNVWAANPPFAVLSEVSNSGVAISPSGGFTGGGEGGSRFLAVDGEGNVWLANNVVGEFSNLGTPISPGTGYGGGLNGAAGIAVDGSGNVWIANESSSTLVEIVGAAAPVVTPLATAAKNNQLGQRP